MFQKAKGIPEGNMLICVIKTFQSLKTLSQKAVFRILSSLLQSLAHIVTHGAICRWHHSTTPLRQDWIRLVCSTGNQWPVIRAIPWRCQWKDVPQRRPLHVDWPNEFRYSTWKCARFSTSVSLIWLLAYNECSFEEHLSRYTLKS